MFGPVKVLRPSVPNEMVLPAAFFTETSRAGSTENAAGFRKRPEGTFENGSPTSVGRTAPQLQTTVNGKPVRADSMIFNCQPPMMALADNRWRMSSDELPRSTSRVSGSVGPERPPLRLSPRLLTTPMPLSIVWLQVEA